MPAYILIIALVALPLIIGAIITTVAYKAYRKRRAIAQDIEHGGIEMRDLEGEGEEVREGGEERDIGVGEEIEMPRQPEAAVTTTTTTTAASAREHPHEISVASFFTAWELEQLRAHNVTIPNYLPNHTRVEPVELPVVASTTHSPGIVELPISSPKPIHTHPLRETVGTHFRFTSTPDSKADSPTSRMYGKDSKIADAWGKIERRESLVASKTPRHPKMPCTATTATEKIDDKEDEFENVGLESLVGSSDDDGNEGTGRIHRSRTYRQEQADEGEDQHDEEWGSGASENEGTADDGEEFEDVSLDGNDGAGWIHDSDAMEDVGEKEGKDSQDGVADERTLEEMKIGSDWSEDAEDEMSVENRKSGEAKRDDAKVLVWYVSSDDE